MTGKRYEELTNELVDLTDEEFKQGWHFCLNFDGLLIGPGMLEMTVCSCHPMGDKYEATDEVAD